jgi:polyhydroxyalkanoate synthesis regulator phasin
MGKIKKKENKDYVDELASTLSAERVKRAELEAEKEIFQIRLSELRQNQGIRQEDMKTFTQSGISKLESRKDMKISTLIEYLDNIGLGVEIKAYSKSKEKNKRKKREYVLLKV